MSESKSLIISTRADSKTVKESIRMTETANPQTAFFSTLDVQGMVCSKPVIKIRIQLKKMKPGETLEVIASEKNYKDLVRLFGGAMCHHIEEIHEGKKVTLLITKSQ